jgi:hypothetical protein
LAHIFAGPCAVANLCFGFDAMRNDMATRKKAMRKTAKRKTAKPPGNALPRSRAKGKEPSTAPEAIGGGTILDKPEAPPLVPAEDADASLLAALHDAIAADRGVRLRRAAELLLTRAADGEHWALKELADRLDGRPAQVVAGERRRPVTVEVVRFGEAKN